MQSLLSLTSLSMFLVLLSFVSFANQIRVVDQNGKPVKNAVVSFVTQNIESEIALPTAIMDQVNQQFSPQVLVIQKGQFVAFPNSDEIRHHVYSFSAINPFEIKLYKGSHEAPIQYINAGVGVLGCNIHDNMVGYIYVADNEIAKVTSSEGEVTFERSLPEEITIWHANLSIQQTQRITLPINKEAKLNEVSVTLLQQEKEASNTFGSRKFGKNG